MATVLLRRSDMFPVGTTVGVYDRKAEKWGGPPTATVIASAAVDAAGLLTVTDAAVLPYTDYVAYALVNSEHRYARVRSTLDQHDYGTAVGTGDTTTGSATVLNAAASSGAFKVRQRVTGPNFIPGTYITAVSGGTLTLSEKASATQTGAALVCDGASAWRAKVAQRRALIGTS